MIGGTGKYEGITGTSTTDSVVLDYSGRISNGTWTGYSTTSRNTGSAIISASAAGIEYEDPIIRTNHSDVTSLKKALLDSGAYYKACYRSAVAHSSTDQ